GLGGRAEGDPRLDGGEGGIEVARRFLEEVEEHLAENGRIYLLLSSLSRKEELEKGGGWKWERLVERKLFFEALAVYRLSRG
ncbi:MAG: hypothetical protein KAT70_04720, partial [Thermoplasmata archaeon]|nr:hypothetical protein [Thermoplasmata archaeon]